MMSFLLYDRGSQMTRKNCDSVVELIGAIVELIWAIVLLVLLFDALLYFCCLHSSPIAVVSLRACLCVVVPVALNIIRTFVRQ